jgi:hypothetical protein
MTENGQIWKKVLAGFVSPNLIKKAKIEKILDQAGDMGHFLARTNKPNQSPQILSISETNPWKWHVG